MNRTSLLAGLAAAALMLTAGAASAQTQGQTQTRVAPAPLSKADFVNARIARLTAMDADGDGTVSVAERRAGRMARSAARSAARFERLDADKDGSISRAEFDAARNGRTARTEEGEPRQARGPGRRAGRHAGAHRNGAHHNGARQMGRRGGAAGEAGHAGTRSAQPVVIAEVRARAEARFDRIDADKDGVIVQAERQAARVAARTEMRERMQSRREARRSHRENTAPASPAAPASE